MALKETKTEEISGFSAVIALYIIGAIIFGGFIIGRLDSADKKAEAGGVVAGISSPNSAISSSDCDLKYSRNFSEEINNRVSPALTQRETVYQKMLADSFAVPTAVKKPAIRKTILRPAARPMKPRCPFPNEKPHNSPRKGHHMDEDCCMDPDEWPNPRCQY